MSSATGETHTYQDPKGKWWWEYHDSEYGSGPQDSGGPHESADEAFEGSRQAYSPSAHFKWPHGSKNMWGDDLFERRDPPWQGKQSQGARMTITRCAVGVHTAHDSGDGQTIYHCPFCGSGQVLARSDRTIECEFCHTSFTVQVQPEFSAFPQTVNGMPMEVPGMPGQVDPGAPVDPNAIGDDGSMMDPGDPMAADAEAADAEEEDAPSDGADNPFVSSLHQTAAGVWLDEENYLAHLAIINSPNPKATAAVVKASRKKV